MITFEREVAKTWTNAISKPAKKIEHLRMHNELLQDFFAIYGKSDKNAWSEAVNIGTKMLENCKELQKADAIHRAWDFVAGWITSNKNRFLPDSTPCFGKIEQDVVYIIPNILHQALEENGFDYSKVTRGFKDRDFMETQIDYKGHIKMQESKISAESLYKWLNLLCK